MQWTVPGLEKNWFYSNFYRFYSNFYTFHNNFFYTFFILFLYFFYVFFMFFYTFLSKFYTFFMFFLCFFIKFYRFWATFYKILSILVNFYRLGGPDPPGGVSLCRGGRFWTESRFQCRNCATGTQKCWSFQGSLGRLWRGVWTPQSIKVGQESIKSCSESIKFYKKVAQNR